MALKIEGIWNAKAISAHFGADDRKIPIVTIEVEIVEGPDVGRRCTYEEEVNAKSAPFAARSCTAVGWKGVDLQTLKADCAAFIASPAAGATTVEIKHLQVKNGKRAGSTWDKVNSIGRRAARVLAPVAADALADANDAMRRAMADDAANDAPVDDLPF